jgi:hypothetical protein
MKGRANSLDISIFSCVADARPRKKVSPRGTPSIAPDGAEKRPTHAVAGLEQRFAKSA